MTREEAIKFAAPARTMTDIPEVKEFYAMAETALRNQEQKHACWNRVEADLGDGVKTHRFACSACSFLKNTLTGNYCPNCGSRMERSDETN